MFCFLFLDGIQQAAGEQNLRLTLGKRIGQRIGLATGDVDQLEIRAVGEVTAHVGEAERIAAFDAVVVGRIGKGQRQDTGVDEVGDVNTRKRLHKHRFDAEVQRCQRRVLTRAALAVVVTADDKALAGLLATRREGRIAAREAMLRD